MINPHKIRKVWRRPGERGIAMFGEGEEGTVETH